ncbi:MAG: hypothetical protein WB784_05975 [Rhodanobacteraceae bacterium]
MEKTTSELLLTLRSPESGWLAAMICAFDEASRDPSFEGYQRGLLRTLLEMGSVPTPVSRAAADRLSQFERTIRHGATTDEAADLDAMCPNLTLSDPVAA